MHWVCTHWHRESDLVFAIALHLIDSISVAVSSLLIHQQLQLWKASLRSCHNCISWAMHQSLAVID